ncbi:DUF1819 family protein [bacterium]|nr:DUF1819 family protein [bacterium]
MRVKSKSIRSAYTTRLQKGGAMLDEMRQLVRSWTDTDTEVQRLEGIRSNVLNRATRVRTEHVFRYTFLPRFVNGPIPNAWKLARPLEDVEASVGILRPVYFWITAKAEPIVADFCREFLLPRQHIARVSVEPAEAVQWLRTKGTEWSPAVTNKVALGLLAALRDFGILEGRARKRLASLELPIGGFAYIAFCLHQLGASSRELLFHPDWELFLLRTREIEQFFLQAHQFDLLQYHAAGSIVRIDFPVSTLKEYARVVVERSN